MGKRPTRQRSKPEDTEIGDLAVNLLAYAAMGAEDALQQLTLATPGITLGAVMVTWYQMCQNAIGSDETAATARVTAQAFQQAMNNLLENREGGEEVKNQALAYSIARGLLIDLATGEMDRFVELWHSSMRFDVEVIVEVVALLLGFTRGVLDAMVQQ